MHGNETNIDAEKERRRKNKNKVGNQPQRNGARLAASLYYGQSL